MIDNSLDITSNNNKKRNIFFLNILVFFFFFYDLTRKRQISLYALLSSNSFMLSFSLFLQFHGSEFRPQFMDTPPNKQDNQPIDHGNHHTKRTHTKNAWKSLPKRFVLGSSKSWTFAILSLCSRQNWAVLHTPSFYGTLFTHSFRADEYHSSHIEIFMVLQARVRPSPLCRKPSRRKQRQILAKVSGKEEREKQNMRNWWKSRKKGDDKKGCLVFVFAWRLWLAVSKSVFVHRKHQANLFMHL